MNRDSFLKLVDEEIMSIRDLFLAKNQSYAVTDDVFSNFRTVAKLVLHNDSAAGMFKTLLVHVMKHMLALCNKGLDDPECGQRLRDLIVYSLIALGMYREYKTCTQNRENTHHV